MDPTQVEAEEKPIDIPSSPWEWLLADKRRLAVGVAGAVVALGVAVALIVAMLSGRGAKESTESTGGTPIPPASSTEATPGAESGDETTSGAGEPIGSGGSEEGETAAGKNEDARPVAPGRAPYVAYRYGGQVWVSREDGTDAVMVADSAHGDFALAPDGTALALIDGGVLSIITVSDRGRVEVGPAQPREIAWAADSSSVLFVRGQENGERVADIWRAARRRGSTPLRIAQGTAARIGMDGTIAALPANGPATDPGKGTVWVLPLGRDPRAVATHGVAAALDVQEGLVAYAVAGMRYTDATGAEKRIEPEVWVMSTGGTSARRLVGRPETARPFGYGNLMLSPDGQWLLYAEVGDDGYSRAWVVSVAGGAPMPLTVRRDTYPLGWGADGRSVFLIEGNAFQGEPTALVRVGVDGLGRRTVVEGAGL
ncbi:MAG: hypothetical protein RBS78_06025 [Coriobacteriia bacterium]|nr:hypothetical protein [Coriobacteriia bacterium]